MATDDQQILVVGHAPAPADFKVPGNGQIQPKAINAVFDGSAASGVFLPTLEIVSDGGVVVARCPAPEVVVGDTAEVSWFPHVAPEVVAAGPTAGVILEELFCDSTSTGVTSSTVLLSGVPYVLTVQGTFSEWNKALDQGTPNADAMFPGSTGGRASTQVGLDADTIFAYPSSSGPVTLGHSPAFQINLGSGYAHVEPQGGPYSTAQTNYLYRYSVTGQGSAVSFRVSDTPIADNYGKLQITIQGLSGGSSGGGGGGSLLPPDGAANALLRAISSVPTWVGQPDIAEADLSLSNVTTANVTTARHGLVPILPNDVTKFFNGTGAYSVPPAASGITDITSTGSTITVSSPTGPTTNVDLPTSGVSAGTYGDSSHVAQVTVDAQGRLTGASSVAFGSGSITGPDGWVADGNSPTFASASTFTAGASDLTSVYSPGTRIKLTQTTVKYFVVASSVFAAGTTTVTITAGTDYTLANAAITSPFYSYVLNPQGYPGWFNFAPAVTGFTGTPTVSTAKFAVDGRVCHVLLTVSGTSNTTAMGATMPIVSLFSSNPGYRLVRITSGGTANLGSVDVGANSATANFGTGTTFNTSGFSNAGTKGCIADFDYGI